MNIENDKYTFICKGLDGQGHPSEITVSVQAGHIDSIVHQFRSFLLACTFHPNTIIRGMQTVIDEYSEE